MSRFVVMTSGETHMLTTQLTKPPATLFYVTLIAIWKNDQSFSAILKKIISSVF